MKFEGIWQDVRVCGNCIYLVLMHGELGMDIRFTALTLLDDEIWDEEWQNRRHQILKKNYPITKTISWLNSLEEKKEAEEK